MLKSKLPPRTVGRLHIVKGEDFPFLVCCALDADQARPEAIMQGKPMVAALLTHDAGIVSTDARGWALAHAIIEGGGTALFGYATLADAMAFKRMVDGGAA